MKIKLKRVKQVAGLALAILACTTALQAKADLAAIKAKGYMTVATEDDYSPYNYVVDGKPEGFHADMLTDLKAFGKKQGIDVRQEILPWTGLLASVSSGQYDVAFTGAIITDERLRVFDFAPPFAPAQHYFVKLKGDDRITQDIKSLCGKTVGVQGGSSFESRLPELKKMLSDAGCELGDIVRYQTYTEAYSDLANKRIDYAINSLVGVNDLVKTRGDVFAKGFPVTAGGFNAWPVSKNNPELLKFYVDFMNDVRQSGRLAELQKKWFGEAFPDLPTQPVNSIPQFHELAGIKG